MNVRHTEFFGPDLARGPFAASRMDAAALQIATALAQLRAPLLRSDSDILAHADFIRQLADRIAPDFAAYVALDASSEASNVVRTSIRTAVNTWSLLDCWLADTPGGGITITTPTAVSFTSGVILQTVLDRRRYLVLTTENGTADVAISYSGTKTWYWAVNRYGRVYYSDALRFT